MTDKNTKNSLVVYTINRSSNSFIFSGICVDTKQSNKIIPDGKLILRDCKMSFKTQKMASNSDVSFFATCAIKLETVIDA